MTTTHTVPPSPGDVEVAPSAIESGRPRRSLLAALVATISANGLLVALAVILAVLALVTDGTSLGAQNVTNLALQNSYVLVLAIGMLMLIIAGHIDLSVGSVVGLSGAVAAQLVIVGDQPWWVGAAAGVGVGVAVGAWQGFWVAVVGVPAWIVTLAGMLLFRGLTFMVLDNTSLSPFGEPYSDIAVGFQRGLFGSVAGGDLLTMLVFVGGAIGYAVTQWRARRGRIAYQQEVEARTLLVVRVALVSAVLVWLGWQLAHERGLPNVLVIIAVVTLVYSAVMRNSVFGRGIYFIGGNRHAAELSGVKVRRLDFWLMTNMGMLSGLAGVIFSSRSDAAQPSAGNAFEMDAIAACFVGGAAVAGGVGTVSATIIGGLVIAVLSNGMQLLGITTSTQQVVKGIVLLLAVAYDLYNRRRADAAR